MVLGAGTAAGGGVERSVSLAVMSANPVPTGSKWTMAVFEAEEKAEALGPLAGNVTANAETDRAPKTSNETDFLDHDRPILVITILRSA
jgi:hypothetical protein